LTKNGRKAYNLSRRPFVLIENVIDRNDAAEKILRFRDSEQVKIITGIRRCGKSVLLAIIAQKIMKSGIDSSHIISINMEDYDFIHLAEPDACWNYLVSKMSGDGRYYIFIDEVQQIGDWEKIISSLRLKNTDIYITGSNSKILSGELATLLSGRYIEFHLGTVSFMEYIGWKRKLGTAEDISKELESYIRFGGYPLAVTTGYSEEKTDAIVGDIFNSTVYKDVITRGKIKDEYLLLKILDYIFDNVGNIFSIRRVSDYINSNGGKSNPQTVANYLVSMEKAFVIKKAPRYDIKGKQLLESMEKYYVADHSLMYARKGYSFAMIAQVLENIVFNEALRRSYKVFVGKTGEKEIDFIAERGAERVYIQVSYSIADPKTLERELAPLEATGDSYRKYIVCMDRLAAGNKNGISLIYMGDFLLMANW